MDALESWHEFDVAMLGATAALAGLVIVAASVNIEVIIKAPALTARLASAIAGLVLAIVVCAVGLIPGLDAVTFGVIVIVAAALTAAFAVDASVRIFQNRHPANRLRAGKAAVSFLTPVVYLVGGVLLASGSTSGLVWLAAGAIAAIVAALFVSWVVLVEVLR
ncbi:hypothetical protein N3K63_11905 [Microbacterium sp. W1N]|uniref:hypothetical protein n=1 Tax=Microbacterium festucae TaxID=2977531 RepID=UPI0021C151B2|nr:hypothetical protein [Microbacterium festucae]MCT9820984.1 hypothetical protein [Microbacterium festucae]